MTDMFRLDGKVAVVTGGGRGIGLMIARGLLHAGASVYLSSRKKAELDAVIDQCLELDLRTAGTSTTGVWGALPEDDRRALHRVWQRRRQQHRQSDQEGGATP